MRKLKLQVQISVDGFIAGPNGEMDWLVWDWDDELKRYVSELTSTIGTIVLGRKLAEGFIPHWTNLAQDPNGPEYAAARIFVDTPKVVFTKSVEHAEWENSVVATGDLVKEINGLKNQGGGDIIAYGGATFVSALIKEDLIDEYHLFVNPAVLGRWNGDIQGGR